MDDMNYIEDIPAADDSRARRAAQRVGLVAHRSRWRRYSIDNYGGYQLIDPRTNFIVASGRFEMDAGDVIAYCSDSDE